jgi:hypothetical protein
VSTPWPSGSVPLLSVRAGFLRLSCQHSYSGSGPRTPDRLACGTSGRAPQCCRLRRPGAGTHHPNGEATWLLHGAMHRGFADARQEVCLRVRRIRLLTPAGPSDRLSTGRQAIHRTSARSRPLRARRRAHTGGRALNCEVARERATRAKPTPGERFGAHAHPASP